ncbi:MAG TPA: CocE/NonD family hydrolase [Micromonosporaceae bacterium]|nr:CocE/NonD family hydrolase [Micromonosporaceae bacterium]
MPSRLLESVLGLPPAVARRVRVTRDVAVRTRDGVPLLTDVYNPAVGPAPAVLIRTPYGRRGATSLLGRLFAERGLHTVVQSCRGTNGSGGAFEPLVHERADGLDTLAWLRRQPWYGGRFGLFGASYQGFVQWAIAADAGDELGAMVAVVSASQTRDSTYAGGAFSLDTVLTWTELVRAQDVPWWSRQVELKRGQPRLRRGLDHLPLAEADAVATGDTVGFFQEWLRHTDRTGDYWRQRVHDERIGQVRAPVALVGGWHDIFLPWQLADYAVLREAGVQPYLTVGGWSHGSVGLYLAALREGLSFLTAHLNGGSRRLSRARVRVQVGGGGGWRALPDWPPPGWTAQPWYLTAGGGLSPAAPAPSTPDTHRYDPADPTPSLGGPLLVGKFAGPVDNAPVEARPDVLTYTSPELAADIEVVGPVEALVHVRSTLPYFDVFVRLCDVDPRGRSWNVCDGLTRVAPGLPAADAEGVQPVRVELWPTAYRFARGHRIRVQVSGGAHPRYARNPGTGEPLGTATELRAGEREVFHDPRRASAVLLPVLHQR